MSLGEVLATFAALMTVIGVPVGILYRQNVKTSESQIAALVEECARSIADLKEAHVREMAACTRELAERDRRLEAANVTESRLIEMALRSTAAGEKIGSAAREAVDRIATRATDRKP